MIVVFDNTALVPPQWNPGRGDVVRVFNPALLRHNDGWLFAYRVVAEPDLRRRIAFCRLDQNLRIVPGSCLPFSDSIVFPDQAAVSPQATTWFADPRLYRLNGRLFLYWNSGWHEPGNHQFLQEFDATSLRPIGFPRELTLSGQRQKLEKNWSLFEANARVYAIYTVNPHRVLAVNLESEGAILCSDLAPPQANPGGYAQVHGGLRGGAPPQLLGPHYYSFCHSIENDPTGYRYVAAAYRFAADAPFSPADMPNSPLALEIPLSARRRLRKLNPAVGDVVYPAGAAYDDGRWLLSIGIDDERCGIAALSHEAVCRTLSPVG